MKKFYLALILIGFGGVFFIYYTFDPASENSYFLPCPFKLVSGYNCPGCGSQRAIHELLNGHVGHAFRLNPLMVLSLPLIFYGLGTKIHNYLYNSSIRFNLFYSKAFIYIYFSIAIVYWVVRNLSFYPFVK